MYTIVGDLHVKPNNLDLAAEVFIEVEKLGNPAIWLGDLLDTKEVIRGKCLNFLINSLKKSKLRHILLVGNHDYFNLECEDHALQALKHLPNVKIIDSLTDLGDDVYAAPFMSDSNFKSIIAKLPQTATLFCHQGITGFDYGNGYIAKDEFDPEDLSGLNIISGHFHKYQQSGNITYLGTPFSHSFGESNQEKFLGIFTTKPAKLKLVQMQLPQHITTEVTNPTQDELEAIITDLDTHNHNRVVVFGTKEALDKLEVSRYSGIKFILKSTDTHRESDLVEESLSNLEQFKYWANEIKGLEKDTIKLGEEILSEVMK